MLTSTQENRSDVSITKLIEFLGKSADALAESPSFREHAAILLLTPLMLIVCKFAPISAVYGMINENVELQELASQDKIVQFHELLKSLPANTQVNSTQTESMGEKVHFIELITPDGESYSFLLTNAELKQLLSIIDTAKNSSQLRKTIDDILLAMNRSSNR